MSNLVNNLSEGIHIIKCKLGHDDKKMKKLGGLNTSLVTVEYKCSCCKKIINAIINKKLKQRFFNIDKLS